MQPEITRAAVLISLLLAACGPESYLPGSASGLGGDNGGGGVGGLDGNPGGSGGGGNPGRDASPTDTGPADAGPPDTTTPVTIHFDFESGSALDGWQPVGSQRPPDVEDQVQMSTAVHHHGASSLAMVFDGRFTPLAASDTPYYGVYTATNAPPAGAVVTLWVMSTVGGVSVQLYAQTKPAYLWQGLLISDSLVANTWTKVAVTMPAAESFYLGCLINSSLDISGTIYLDEISW
jgi:hypothetical protein